MDIYDLWIAYKKARKLKRRSADNIQFELHQFECLGSLCDDIHKGVLKASTYCFIHKRQKSREVWASDMSMKILQVLLDNEIRPVTEHMLTDKTFNNRKGKGSMAAINNVIEDIYTVTNNFATDAYIIKLDLKGYFPNINQNIAWDITSKLIIDNFIGEERDFLLMLSRFINFYNPQFSSQRRSSCEQWNEEIAPYKSLFYKPFGTGAAIGFLYWQVMSNVYLNEIDRWLMANITPYYTRYVDDMVLIVKNKELALATMPKLREELQRYDITIHPSKFYCQNVHRGLEFLGYHIKPSAVHLNRRIYNKAKMIRTKDTSRFICQINSYLGMLKSSSDTNLVEDLINSIHRKDVKIDYNKMTIKAL